MNNLNDYLLFWYCCTSQYFCDDIYFGPILDRTSMLFIYNLKYSSTSSLLHSTSYPKIEEKFHNRIIIVIYLITKNNQS